MTELDSYQPIGMLESLVLTVGYVAEYGSDRHADEVPEPEVVVIPQFNLDRFLENDSLKNIFGLDESSDFTDREEGMFYCETLAEQMTYHKGWCPYIINAIYVDMMGRVSVPDVDALAPFPSAKRG